MSTKTTKLTQSEKYQIQGMLHNNIDISEIASQLNRTEKSITNYVDGELDGIYNTVVKVAAEQAAFKPKNKTPMVYVDAAIAEITSKGVKLGDAKELVRRACVQYATQPFESTEALIHVALLQKNAKDLMITASAGDSRKNVAIMTKEASERLDDRRKNMNKKTSRVTRGNIYQIKEDRVI